MAYIPPGSPIHGIFQARVLEWGAVAFSEPGRGSTYIKALLRCGQDATTSWEKATMAGAERARATAPKKVGWRRQSQQMQESERAADLTDSGSNGIQWCKVALQRIQYPRQEWAKSSVIYFQSHTTLNLCSVQINSEQSVCRIQWKSWKCVKGAENRSPKEKRRFQESSRITVFEYLDIK